ncbi:MAG: undecaprenyldiphospho-muramoylpentapeptide beta-N-acetylglucosaminyltransferase [Saprospiraceae bacterium]|nr:undecaprenyldiphospho-muramoylpentapeptide beta-N-acetylglucosaminyltransferase [Saprospiraceae bacterium]
MRIIISGGGTGGHVFPAIAIADAIKRAAPESEILFVGAKGKIEMEKVPKAGYKIEGLNVVGFQRTLTAKNLLFPFRLAGAMWHAFRIVQRFRPQVAVGVGGYASGPVLKIANLLGIRTVLQEQNSYAGVTNRLLAAKASAICVAYENMERFFPADKIVFTGNPVRSNLIQSRIDKTEAKQRLGFDPQLPLVLVVGGSLGARTINEAVLNHYRNITAGDKVQLMWQSGKGYYESCRQRLGEGSKNIQLLPFIENMDLAYSAADLVVCRAGALTISEMAVLGKPAILIPSPNVAEDHQTVNAMSLVQREAAVLVRDAEAFDKLGEVINQLMADEDKRKKLGENIRFFAREDAAVKIAEVVLKIGST